MGGKKGGKSKSGKGKGGKGGKSKGKGDKKKGGGGEVKFGTACFNFRNKDHYEGGYKACNKPESACKHGFGTYKTADGQTYTGMWQDDILNGEVDICYADGAKYSGNVENLTYVGQGMYAFKDGSSVTCRFLKSRPTGDMVISDPGGHKWHGVATTTSASFLPVNRFLPTEDVAPRYRPLEPIVFSAELLELASDGATNSASITKTLTKRHSQTSKKSKSKISIEGSKPSLIKKIKSNTKGNKLPK